MPYTLTPRELYREVEQLSAELAESQRINRELEDALEVAQDELRDLKAVCEGMRHHAAEMTTAGNASCCAKHTARFLDASFREWDEADDNEREWDE